jgi:hypothetical protein
MAIDGDVWMHATLVDNVRALKVGVRFDRSAPDAVDDQVWGVVDPPDEVPIGKAMSLRLDDGRRALVVVVDGHGRFLTSGPVWRDE